MLLFILLLINSALMFKIDYTFSLGKLPLICRAPLNLLGSPKSVGLPYFCGAPLFLWRSPKSAEALFYQWLPQMRAAPPNLFLKKAHRKWPFSYPKHEENGPKKKLWLDIYVEKGFWAKESAQLVIPVRSTFQNDLHPPIGGPHPVLYFTTQIKKKYCTAMC